MSTTAETIGRYPTSGRTAPSRIWYWVAVAIAVLGVGVAVTWGIASTLQAHDRAESLVRTDAPGRLEIRADAGTSKLIYFEGDARPSLDALGLGVTAPDGSSVRVEPYDLVMKYEIAGWQGTPVASFSAPVTGAYAVSVDGTYPDGHVAAGDNFVRTQAVNIVGALILLVASVAAGVVMAVVVAVRRLQVVRK